MKNNRLKKLFWLVIVFSIMSMIQVGVALGAENALSASEPSTGAVGVPINQVITLTTEFTCTTTPSGILLDGSPLPNTNVSIQSGKIVCVPVTMLTGGKIYTLTIPIGQLQDAVGGNTNAVAYTVTFTTAYNLDLMISNSYSPTTLNSLMATYSPRGLNITVPKKYLTKFNIAYSTISTQPLTNVDITADAQVAHIKVTFGSDVGGPNIQYNAIKTGSIWNTGYEGILTTTDSTGKVNGRDITFEAYDQYNRLLEKKTTIRLDPKGKKVDLSSAKSLAVPTTFADLILSNGKLFTKILGPYTVDELFISVDN